MDVEASAATWGQPPGKLTERLIPFTTGGVGVLCFLACLMPLANGAQPVSPSSPAAATNYVLVTNVVVVTITNYVVTTNAVLSTNIPAASQTNDGLPHLSWVPPEDQYDWIQLKSGEWLKGKIKAMQDDKLEFDSEELDLVSFDWKDVRQLRSPHVTDVMFEDRTTESGPIQVTPDEVRIKGDKPRIVPRASLLSLTPGGKREANYWSGKVAAGATYRAGNTKETEYNAKAELQRRTPATRLRLDYVGYYSSTEDTETANSHRASETFDVWLSRRLFVRAPFAEYFRDPFQNIAHRATGGAGLGYDLVDHPKLEWNVTAGPAYQYTWFDSVPAGDADSVGAAALVFTTRFDWEISSRVDLILEYKGQYTKREVGETTHHGESTLSLEVTRRLDLDLSLYWDRTAYPKPNADGTVPKQDDFRLVLALGIDF